MSPTLHYEFCARTDAGCVRANNEDAVSVEAALNIVLLADGMGGYNAGEIASALAVSHCQAALSQWLVEAGPSVKPADLHSAMEWCVYGANDAILQEAETNPQYAGMGTTLVVGVFHGASLMLGHIGDSRCYRLRGGTLTQITRDHSWLQEQMDAGLMTREQAAVSNSRNLVTRALGVDEMIDLEVNEFEVQPDDLYLLCSDGLSEMLTDAQMRHFMLAEASLPVLADRLIAAANAHGGRDNISVVLARVGRQGGDSGQKTKQKPGLVSRLLRS